MGEGLLLCTIQLIWPKQRVLDYTSLLTHTHGRRGAEESSWWLLCSTGQRLEKKRPWATVTDALGFTSTLLWLQLCFLGEGRWAQQHSSIHLLCVKRWLPHPLPAKGALLPLSPRRHHLPFSAQQLAPVWHGAEWCQTSPAPPWLHAPAE